MSTVSCYVNTLMDHSLYSQHSNVMTIPLLLSTCIYLEDDSSETLCRTITDTVKEKALLLDKQKKFHEDRFGMDTHNIPDYLELCLSKTSHGGSISTNTYNSARKLSSLFVEEITKICKDKSIDNGEDPDNFLIMRTDFHNHFRNLWIGAITKCPSKYLDDILFCDL